MKHCTVILFVFLSCTVCFAGPPKTKEEFLQAVRAACEGQDLKRLHELTWEKGVSDFDRKMFDQTMPMMLKDASVIKEISFEPLPSGIMQPQVAFGRRATPTSPPEGVVKMVLRANEPRGSLSMSMPYAVIEGGYYLITMKSTDLGWEGPADRPFTVNLSGHGMEKTKVHIKYNASGVDLESDGCHGFACQFISEVTVTSEDEDVDVTLSIADGMKNIYESKPLNGKGRLVYKKGDKTEN